MARISARRSRRPSTFRRRVFHWIDPYPQIPGTLPEKQIFDALMRRHLYFIFQGNLKDAGITDSTLLQDVGFQPDIILPEYRVIFDPFGDFAHSKPHSVGERFTVRERDPITGKMRVLGTAGSVTESINLQHIGRDAWKSVYYRSLGFEFIHPWSTDIAKKGGDWVVDQSERLKHPPQFKLDPVNLRFKITQGYRLGASLGAGAHAQAIANSKRRRPKMLGLRRR